MKTRDAIFSGSWYPASASECEREIKEFLKTEQITNGPSENRIGGIVPHAGWYFSGAIACNVIKRLSDETDTDVVIVFGMHLHTNSQPVIMREGAWETPFGLLEIEQTLAGELARKFAFTVETPERFIRDNTIELQLPFIKYFFKNAKIVPIGVPPVNKSLEIGEAAADIAARLGLRIKVVGSTDLTHYGSNYGFSPKGSGPGALEWMRDTNDRKVIEAMLEMNPQKVIDIALTDQNACCSGAAATAIAAAKKLGAVQAEAIAYATSHDKNPGDSFVGYVGILFSA